MTDLAGSDRIPAHWRGKEVVQLIGHSAYGGGVPIVFGIMRAIAALDLRPVVLATHPDVVAAAEQEGFEVWGFGGIVREPRPLHDTATALALSRALRARGVSAIHTHTSKGGMIGRLAGRLAGCPLVIHHTHGFYHTAMEPGVARAGMLGLERFFGRVTDYQVFLSDHALAAAVAEGTSSLPKARVVQNGIPTPTPVAPESARNLREEWGVPEDALLVGSISRLANREKGLDVGLRAFASLRSMLPGVWWVIVGEGDDREELARLASDLGISDRVVMPGHRYDAGKLNACFDATFAPSRREGQSVSIMEAMACGTPIVSTRIPGNEGLVEDGVTAVLVQPDDDVAMTEALARVLTDRSLAVRLGEAAAARFKATFTEDAFETRIKNLYTEVLNNARPR